MSRAPIDLTPTRPPGTFVDGHPERELVQRQSPNAEHYDPAEDWINQCELAGLLGVALETASRWASRGKLAIFEHDMLGAGKRKYNRRLVREYQALSLSQARARFQYSRSSRETT